jgi:hypothetical protein
MVLNVKLNMAENMISVSRSWIGTSWQTVHWTTSIPSCLDPEELEKNLDLPQAAAAQDRSDMDRREQTLHPLNKAKRLGSICLKYHRDNPL